MNYAPPHIKRLTSINLYVFVLRTLTASPVDSRLKRNYVGLTIFHGIFSYVSHIQSECGKYPRIFCGTLSIPHNIVMDLNNVTLHMEFKCDIFWCFGTPS